MASRRSFLKLLGAAFAAPAAAAKVATNVLRGAPVRTLRYRWHIQSAAELCEIYGSPTVEAEVSQAMMDLMSKWIEIDRHHIEAKLEESFLVKEVETDINNLPKLDVKIMVKEIDVSRVVPQGSLSNRALIGESPDA